MPIIQSKIKPDSELFQSNVAAMSALVATLNADIHTILQGGGESAQQHQKAKGKLPVRERIDLLLDQHSPFLEISPFAAWNVYPEAVPCAGIVAGIGQVHSHPCMVIANDPTVKGGTYYPLTVKKHLRAQAIAQRCKIPCVYLVDSGGANLPHQAEVFADKEHFGRIFFNQAKMSSEGIAQIAVVLGLCTAGGAYIPAMSDIAIMVKQQASIFLAGPPLVKAATGEVVSEEELGGADVHCRKSGVADYYAESEAHAMALAREALANTGQDSRKPVVDVDKVASPRYPADELYGIVNANLRLSFDVREVIARLVDDSEFDEFKALFGTTLVCGFARIDGHLIGILANNGILFSESAQKGAHFIELCAKRHIPLLFLQNITGFMVGKRVEEGGIAKHGAKLVMAVACAEVPKFTVVIGGSYGAGNYAMCGRAYDPTMMWMWPNARISVMGGEQAAGVLTEVKSQVMQRKETPWPESEQQQFRQEILDLYEQQGHPYYASARLWDDGIIDPKETRNVLAQALNATSQSDTTVSQFGIFRM